MTGGWGGGGGSGDSFRDMGVSPVQPIWKAMVHILRLRGRIEVLHGAEVFGRDRLEGWRPQTSLEKKNQESAMFWIWPFAEDAEMLERSGKRRWIIRERELSHSQEATLHNINHNVSIESILLHHSFKQNKVRFDCCNKFRTRRMLDSQFWWAGWEVCWFTRLTGYGGCCDAPRLERCIAVIRINPV